MAKATFEFDGPDPHDLADQLDALSNTLMRHLVEALETWTTLVQQTRAR